MNPKLQMSQQPVPTQQIPIEIVTIPQQNPTIASNISSLSVNNNNNGWSIDWNEVSDQVKQSWKDETKAKCCSRCCWILIIFIGLITLYYEYMLFSDPKINTITRSNVEPLNYIQIPYIYIAPTYGLTGVALDFIWRHHGVDESYIPQNVTYYYNINEFEYTSSNTDWSVVYWGSSIVAVPPYGEELNIEGDLYFRIQCYTNNIDIPLFIENEDNITYNNSNNFNNNEEDSQDDIYDTVIKHSLNGLKYGIWWFADNIEVLQDNNNISSLIVNQFYGNNLNMEFTQISTINYIQINYYERINNILQTDEDFVEVIPKSSVLDKSMSYYVWDNRTDYNYYWWIYHVDIEMYINPAGGGVKTVITTDYLYTYFDILSKTGGIISPIKDCMIVLLAWVLFGFPLLCCCRSGLAGKKGLSDDEKKRVKLYLEELKLLNSTNEDIVDKIVKNNKTIKKKSKCCC